jgi:hypothetical protein
MPYLNAENRERVERHGPDSPGELNYLLTRLAVMYLQRRGSSYATLNEVMGALECCKLEFYRRAAVPYEMRKIDENGDVYTESTT